MSIIRPFRALRPAIEKAKQVSCVPYDVAHEREVRAFIEDNPESFFADACRCGVQRTIASSRERAGSGQANLHIYRA